MSWEAPADKYRDEDYAHPDYGIDEERARRLRAARRAEIGSESWVRAEIAAGRSGEERDA